MLADQKLVNFKYFFIVLTFLTFLTFLIILLTFLTAIVFSWSI
jgi:hypothetical protein